MATIFFMSFSLTAVMPARIVVAVAVHINIFFIMSILMIIVNRFTTQTPAVTRVEECTRAEVGVGAAMAAGNQAENGICALFVIAANSSSAFKFPSLVQLFHVVSLVVAIVVSRAASPSRLVYIVRRLEFNLIWFW